MDQRLRRHERLTNAADFTRCYRHGKRLRTHYFTVYAYRWGDSAPRLGLAVGKTVGIAVVRNRVKRRLRELFRRQKVLVPRGYDLFIRAGPASAAVSYAALEVAWAGAMLMLKSDDTQANPESRDA
ncbi:MAG TPA: ribonuclease P protein component [Candidatus Tectomicrobia bacterium]